MCVVLKVSAGFELSQEREELKASFLHAGLIPYLSV